MNYRLMVELVIILISLKQIKYIIQQIKVDFPSTKKCFRALEEGTTFY